MLTKTKAPLTVVVIAKNEEKRLTECLQSVSWAEEILVIDDDSTDGTVELAKSLGAKVHRRTMDIEGRQRNFGFELAAQPWILTLDADERVTPELAEEIQKAISIHQDDQEVAGFALPIKTFIGTRWVKGAGYYPARKTRMFRKGRFKYEEARVHPRALYEGKIVELNGDVLHYSCTSLAEFLHKFNRETGLEAEKWVIDGRKVSLAKSLRKTVDRFLKNYFLKDGWRDGYLGYAMSVFHGLYQFLAYAKYWEIKQSPPAVFIDRDGVINKDLFGYVKDWESFRFEEGVIEGLKRLTQAGYRIVVVSNQAGVGDGEFSEEAHWEIHGRMKEELARQGIALHSTHYCLHGKNAGCSCRKPKTGLFRKAEEQGLVFDKTKTFFIGDKAGDIRAGKDFGIKTLLVRTGYGKQDEPLCRGELAPEAVVDNFKEAVDFLLCRK